MPNTTIHLAANTVTLITSSDVTACRIQNQSGNIIHILGTFGTAPPNSVDGSFVLLPYSAIGADILISEIFPGVTNVNRLFAYSAVPATLSVSHA